MANIVLKQWEACQINVIRRKELVHFSQERRSRPILEKRNREHRSSDGFKVQGKYIPGILTLCSCGYLGRSNSARIIKLLQQR